MTRTIPIIPAPTDAGVVEPVASYTEIIQGLSLALQPPRTAVYLATPPGTATTGGSWALVTWDTLVPALDSSALDGTMWVTANKSRLLFPYQGTWLVTAVVNYVNNLAAGGSASSDAVALNIRKNAAGVATGGTSVVYMDGNETTGAYGTAPSGATFKLRHSITVAANDYVELFHRDSYQSGSTTGPLLVGGADSTFMQTRMVSTT